MDKDSIIVDSNVFIDTFDENSPNHEGSVAFIEKMVQQQRVITMPMHGFFEVKCTIRNKQATSKSFTYPVFDGKWAARFEFIHIDDVFLKNYQDVEIPYIKGMDHIFIVVAKKNELPLITSDIGMIKVAKKAGVKVYTPTEYLRLL